MAVLGSAALEIYRVQTLVCIRLEKEDFFFSQALEHLFSQSFDLLGTISLHSVCSSQVTFESISAALLMKNSEPLTWWFSWCLSY